ncbi:WAT1-related protein At4g30420-like [Euphorbia lathyris]|uniref:WAT1-related protein At4g30420-like n=1 Tax=Euphorbia lathyris TaxID=212925 RepID=UPI003313F837
MGGILENYKAEMAMVGLQFLYAGVSLISRAALLQGMSPAVFVFYRQSIATLTIAPIAYFSRRKSDEFSLGLKNLPLIFLASLIGVTINQNLFFEGIYLASSSMGSAMGNLVPAVTFAIAAFLGIEKIKLRSIRSLAKIGGTILCVGGAISMALLRGSKLLNTSILGSENWLLGSLLLFASACCWSCWLILQVPITKSCSDHLSVSAWMCFMAAIQSAAVVIFIEPHPISWKLKSHLEVLCCLFTGIIGSGLAFFVQAWCISKRGPLFSAMFNPLCTVIVTILAALFLHEEIYMGSMIGGVGVIMGLYVVLWGKAKDFVSKDVSMLKDESVEEEGTCKNDMEQPLLLPKSNTTDNGADAIDQPRVEL